MSSTYPTAHRSRRTTADPAAAETRTERGISLARGPALILGTILLAAGLYLMYKAHTYARWSNFTGGTPARDGDFFFGIFGANGWTGLFTAVCGGVLLFGAAQHHLAKAASLIVGIALGAAAIIAAVSGNVLGMAAANVWTEVLWGASAVILLFNVFVPRRRRVVEVEEVPATAGPATTSRAAREPARTEPVADGRTGDRYADGRGGEPVAGGRTAEPYADGRGGEPVAGGRAAEPYADGRGGEPVAGGRTAEPYADGRGGEPMAEGRGSGAVAGGAGEREPLVRRVEDRRTEGDGPAAV